MRNTNYNLRTYHTNHLDTDDLIYDINSREELQKLELQEFGEIGRGINWQKWDELVNKVKDELASIPKPLWEKKQQMEKFAYDLTTKQLIHFNSTKECAQWYGVIPEYVATYASRHKPCYRYNVFWSNIPLLEDEIPNEKQTNQNPNEKEIYAYFLDTKQFIKKFKSTKECARFFKLNPSQPAYCINNRNGRYRKGNLFFSYQPQSI